MSYMKTKHIRIMPDPTKKEIEEAFERIEKMDQFTMCRIWRFAPESSWIYLRSDLPTGSAFVERLFKHFGGFTPEISKELGWE